MIIGGIQKNSFIDYPGKPSCVLFVSGCNFSCPYCHNPQLVNNGLGHTDLLDEKEIYEFLKNRIDLIDGVVISGGEPTLQNGLVLLCKKIKEMNYLVKLDTNGSNPKKIKVLIDEGLVDYVAMDIKSDPFHYPSFIAKDQDPNQILLSIETIMGSGTPYEFRTTCVKPIVDKKNVKNIAKTIEGAEQYVLQRFHNRNGVLNPLFFKKNGGGHNEDELKELKTIAEPWVKKCFLRL